LDLQSGADPLPAGLLLGEYETLAEPLDPAKLAAIIEASRESTPASASEVAAAPTYEVPPLAAEASIEAFAAVDLRVGAVLACEAVAGSNKLLRLTIDLGPLGQRTIFSGIALSYSPDALVGKRVVVFANLKPRKMRFGVSEGMVLAAGAADDSITVLELDPRSRPGDKIT
jgi:methionyl-tRNA synthetase